MSLAGATSAPPWLDVSRETIANLERMLQEVLRWNSAINLISPGTKDTAWTRHVLDSAQLIDFVVGRSGHWVDLGSGGGFPGLVLAVIAKETAPNLRFTLVESDQRKATFLQQTARTLAVDVSVVAERAERLGPLEADVISARALRVLADLLPYAHRHLRPSGIALFLKGVSFQQEVTVARQEWSFDAECLPSRTNPSAGLVVVRNIAHV